MKKLSIFLLAIFSVCVGFSFASPSIINPSYTVNGNDVKIYWTDNSNWWYLDINLQNPETNDWLHFGTTKISDQVFTYTKQWDWDQKVWLIPWDGGDEVKLTITIDDWKEKTDNKTSWATRTVIPVVPKTGPSLSLIWLILATLAIFGGYIYIKKRADI